MIHTDLNDHEEKLLAVLSSDRFVRMQGLGNDIPFFIYPYPPERAIAVVGAKKRIVNKLSQKGISVLEINLYDLAVEILKARGAWDRVLQVEALQRKDDFRQLLQGMLDPESHIAPAIRSRITDSNFDILFLTGIGEVFPYIRSHNVLNNLQSIVKDKPMLMYFPGTYEQSDHLGSSLVLFGKLRDDQYYRARNILEQGA